MGWQCVYYLVATILISLLVTAFMDDPTMDPDMLDPGRVNTYIRRSFTSRVVNQFLMFFLLNMLVMGPMAPYRAWHPRHVLKLVIRHTEHIIVICAVLWGFGTCPVHGMYGHFDGLGSDGYGITSLSCAALLIIFVFFYALNFSIIVFFCYFKRDTFVTVNTYEAWKKKYDQMQEADVVDAAAEGDAEAAVTVTATIAVPLWLAAEVAAASLH